MNDKLYISRLAASMSLVEISIGSIVHGLKIPFGGHALSITQGAFLTRSIAIKGNQVSAFKLPIYVSTIASCLKSLSPAGTKLGPMLSIWMQGFLMALPIGILGPNTLGIVIGLAALSLWAFVQPIITLYVFFGKDLFSAFEFYLQKFLELGLSQNTLWLALTAFVLIKMLLCVLTGLWVRSLSPLEFEKTLEHIETKAKSLKLAPIDKRQQSKSSVFLLALKDMTQPFFLFSFALGILFFVFSRSQMSEVIWLSLRPLAVAYLFFLLSRSSAGSRFVGFLKSKNIGTQFFTTLDATISILMKDKDLR